jgi:hypothetical protein
MHIGSSKEWSLPMVPSALSSPLRKRRSLAEPYKRMKAGTISGGQCTGTSPEWQEAVYNHCLDKADRRYAFLAIRHINHEEETWVIDMEAWDREQRRHGR